MCVLFDRPHNIKKYVRTLVGMSGVQMMFIIFLFFLRLPSFLFLFRFFFPVFHKNCLSCLLNYVYSCVLFWS